MSPLAMAITSLSASIEPLREAFGVHTGRARMIALMSPT
jgi:hypothetical protein